MTTLIGIIISALILIVIVWGGDGLIKLVPGDGKLKQGLRIFAIVVLTIFCLVSIAGYFNIPLPWNGPTLQRHR
jgi:hypothetical protein